MFFNFFLPDQIPDDNFNKVLKKHLDLRFIYYETKDIYIQLRLDLLYFIDHDISEAPPDHSIICINCSKQKSCAGANGVKKIEHTIYREEY
jgi:hypothetical protein